ncbi:unnamed protein product [Eretmochelys imbricata]
MCARSSQSLSWSLGQPTSRHPRPSAVSPGSGLSLQSKKRNPGGKQNHPLLPPPNPPSQRRRTPEAGRGLRPPPHLSPAAPKPALLCIDSLPIKTPPLFFLIWDLEGEVGGGGPGWRSPPTGYGGNPLPPLTE